jgi:hypothetical protein
LSFSYLNGIIKRKAKSENNKPSDQFQHPIEKSLTQKYITAHFP